MKRLFALNQFDNFSINAVENTCVDPGGFAMLLMVENE